MKFTITFIAFLSLSSAWGLKVNKNVDDLKDKREVGSSYPTSLHSSHSFQSPALGHDDSNSISIGAGYSVGGAAKPGHSYGGQVTGAYQVAPEAQPPSAHSTIQLAPVTLQSPHGGLVGTDLSELMNQISQGLNSGALSLNGAYQTNYPSQNNYAGSFLLGSDSQHGYNQEQSLPQIEQGAQKYQQYSVPNQPLPSPPSYSAGTKGLGSYSSTGPVLFTPNEQQSHQQSSMNLQSAGHGFAEGLSLFGGSGQSLSAFNLPGPHSGPSQASVSFGNAYASGHGGSPYKGLHSGLLVSGKSSFKPSVYLGSGPTNSIHSLSSSFRGGPSFSIPHAGSNYGSLSLGSGAHGPTFNFGSSTKFGAPSFVPAKFEGNGAESYPSVASLLPNGHFSSPPGTTYGIPVHGAHNGPASNAAHSASSIYPKYYSPVKSQSFKAPFISQSSFSSGPKLGSHLAQFTPSKDIQGSYSDNVYTYNTIKYSEELKPKSN